MSIAQRLELPEIEVRICAIIADAEGHDPRNVSPDSRMLEDLGCDSIGFIEVLYRLEDAFDFDLDRDDSVAKTLFTRSPFRVRDLAELVYLYQGTGRVRPVRGRRKQPAPQLPALRLPFTQLSGVHHADPAHDAKYGHAPLFEPWSWAGATNLYRRRTDGMRCILIPAATVEIGDDRDGELDAQPQHVVELDAFLIDAEPVSTTAYCRFLNSLGDLSDDVLRDWFVPAPHDDRVVHLPIENRDERWRPIAGAEHWPMTLVSWYGANAYSLWANERAWHRYRADADLPAGSFLPTEAQWEYAARGTRSVAYPWGDAEPTPERMRSALHRPTTSYELAELPFADVHAELGMSPFGLHHMAGNVWQWCRDRYADDFYRRPEATSRNAANLSRGDIRSERGGSWVGPARLCRSSYRRGRNPEARGRCLGFRCVSETAALPNGPTRGAGIR